MRFRPASRVVTAGASLAAIWASPSVPAQADILVGSTFIPTSSVVATSAYLPTSYVVPTSTYLPTSYVVPTTSYLRTSSVFATSYLPSARAVTESYYRGGLIRPRRFVERTSYYSSPTTYLSGTSYLAPTNYLTPTSYLAPTSYITPTSYLSSSLFPTSYVVPTISTIVPTTYLSGSSIAPTSYLVDDGLIRTSATSTVCCDSGSPTMSVPVEPAALPTRALAPRVQATQNDGGKTITSQPQNNVSAAPPAERAPSAAIRQAPSDLGTSSAVVPPATAPRSAEESGSPPPADGLLEAPLLPAPGTMGQPPGEERIDRTSLRPNYSTERTTSRNVLRGKVVSYDSGRPEEMVAVVLTNRSGRFSDRKTLTDADGEFKISLPDGDWAVKVTMPSDSIYTVGAVTASSGKVIDPYGKNVAEMIIKR